MAGAMINPIRDVPRRRYSNARERFSSANEAERLFKALDASESLQLKSSVMLLLLTGARQTELLTAEWQHVDLERRAWLIPTTKTGICRFATLRSYISAKCSSSKGNGLSFAAVLFQPDELLLRDFH